jgi:hypothetical protein
MHGGRLGDKNVASCRLKFSACKANRTTDNSGSLAVVPIANVTQLCVLAWRTALAARGARYRFFEHLRTITAYIVFNDWTHRLQSIADPKARPP